jgi:hypothetical protein
MLDLEDIAECINAAIQERTDGLKAENARLMQQVETLVKRVEELEAREVPAVEEIAADLTALVERRIASIDVPEVEFDFAAMEKRIEESLANRLRGQDGVGISEAIKKDGRLILILTNGKTLDVGRVDGETFTLDDFDIVRTDERTIEMSFTRGEVKHTFELSFPVPHYKGVWKSEVGYAEGDCVTWGGSLWHCNKETSGKPGEGDDWTLAVKKGRDAK